MGNPVKVPELSPFFWIIRATDKNPEIHYVPVQSPDCSGYLITNIQ